MAVYKPLFKLTIKHHQHHSKDWQYSNLRERDNFAT